MVVRLCGLLLNSDIFFKLILLKKTDYDSCLFKRQSPEGNSHCTELVQSSENTGRCTVNQCLKIATDVLQAKFFLTRLLCPSFETSNPCQVKRRKEEAAGGAALLQVQAWSETGREHMSRVRAEKVKKKQLQSLKLLWPLKSDPLNKLFRFSALLCTCSSLCQQKECPGSQDRAKLEKCNNQILNSWQSVPSTLDGSE